MSMERDRPRVTQQEVKPLEVKPMPIQLAFGETAKVSPNGIELIVESNLNYTGSRNPFSATVDSAVRQMYNGEPASLVIPRLYREGKTGREIAGELGISQSSVYGCLRKTETPRRVAARNLIGPKILNMFGDQFGKELTAEEIVAHLYLHGGHNRKGLNIPAIAEIIEISENSAARWVGKGLKKVGGKMRTKQKSLRNVWSDKEKRDEILAKLNNPATNKKRSESRIAYFARHPEAVDMLVDSFKRSNVRRSKEKINLVKKALGVRTKAELREKLQSLYDSEGSIAGLVELLEQKNAPIAPGTIEKMFKWLKIEKKPAREVRRMAGIREEDMQLVLRVGESKNINLVLPPDDAKVMSLRFRSKLSLRAIAKILGTNHEDVRLRLRKDLKILKRLEMQGIKPPVDS